MIAGIREASRTKRSWLSIFVLLNLVDVAQTTLALHFGAVELNPLADMMGLEQFLAVKVLAALFVGYVLRRNILLFFLSAGMLGAVLGNMLTLGHMFF